MGKINFFKKIEWVMQQNLDKLRTKVTSQVNKLTCLNFYLCFAGRHGGPFSFVLIKFPPQKPRMVEFLFGGKWSMTYSNSPLIILAWPVSFIWFLKFYSAYSPHINIRYAFMLRGLVDEYISMIAWSSCLQSFLSALVYRVKYPFWRLIRLFMLIL